MSRLSTVKNPIVGAPLSILHLWVPAPLLLHGGAVMQAWGYTYRTNFVWDKGTIGIGYCCRVQHEMLLFGPQASSMRQHLIAG
jgi:N6-adenosine-specific RNA methylase IME4